MNNYSIFIDRKAINFMSENIKYMQKGFKPTVETFFDLII